MKGGGNVSGKIVRASYSLEPEYDELLGKIAKVMRSNKTAELRRMIDEKAVELGLTPIAPVFPKKALAPSLERLQAIN